MSDPLINRKLRLNVLHNKVILDHLIALLILLLNRIAPSIPLIGCRLE